jgi:hypothetical protein
MFDPMADLTDPTGSEDPLATSPSSSSSSGPRSHGGGRSGGDGHAQRDGRYAQELHSVTVRARQRTFYIDLKQSGQGKFFKMSEKSRGGQKSTVMFDVEDLPKIIEALQEMQSKI